MGLLNLSCNVADYGLTAELTNAAGTITVFVTMPSGIRIHRIFDLGPLIEHGMSEHDALDYTLRAVSLGLEAGVGYT